MAHSERRHTLHTIEIGATAYGGLTQTDFNTGIQVDRTRTSGSVQVRHQSIAERKYVASWTSKHLKDWLGVCGIGGFEIDAEGTGVKLYLGKRSHGGKIFVAGANHPKYTVVSGIIIPQRISCQHGQGQSAEISYQLHATYDGSNEPVQGPTLSALPTVPDDDERYGMGPITLPDAKVYAGKLRFELDFGLQVEAFSTDSDVDPTEVSIQSVEPVLTIGGVDPHWFGADYVPADGLELAHAATSIYLRRYKHGGKGFEADGSAKHVKMTVDGLAYLEQLFSASQDGNSETVLKVPLEHDGTNEPVVITTDVAIT